MGLILSTLRGPMWSLKEIENVHWDFILLMHLNADCNTWNDNLRDLQSLHKIWYLVLETLNTNPTLNITNPIKVSNIRDRNN